MIVHAGDVLHRQGIDACVADAARGADLDTVFAVRRRPDEQPAMVVPGSIYDGRSPRAAQLVQPAVELPAGDGGVNPDAVGPAGFQLHLETVAVAGQLDLTGDRRPDAEQAGLAVRDIVRPDLLHQQLVCALAAAPGADGDVVLAGASGGQEQAAVEPCPAVVVIGVREQCGAGVINAQQAGIVQGAGAARGAFQVDAVRHAGLQIHFNPVDVAPGLDLAGRRAAGPEYARGRCVLAVIVRHERKCCVALRVSPG